MCPNNNNNVKMSTTSIPNNKCVKFDQVFIHEFEIILGDNPAVSKGAPLTIDWKPFAHDVIDLDIYEYLREPERRHRKRMILSTSKRAKILMKAGYSIDDIAEMTLQVEDAKRVRAEHALESASFVNSNTILANLKSMNIMELLSGAAEGTGRTLFLGAGQASKVGYEVKKVVVGTGKVGYNVVATTGKVTTDLAVGTVKGTGKVVVGAGKATGKVVVGTGKLGYDVVKSTGKRMSKILNLNDSFSKDLSGLDESDLGYEDADAALSSQSERGGQWSRRASFRMQGTPAPQRMKRRSSTSVNGSVALQVASRRASATGNLQQTVTATRSKPKRRGSGNSAQNALAGSFSNMKNMFTGRGVRRTNSSSDNKSATRRTKSGGSRRTRRASLAVVGATPTSPRSKSASTTTSSSSELAQMEQFLSYVREADPGTVNPIINQAYHSSSSSVGYDHQEDSPSQEDRKQQQQPSPPHSPEKQSISVASAPLPPPTAEVTVTPVA